MDNRLTTAEFLEREGIDFSIEESPSVSNRPAPVPPGFKNYRFCLIFPNGKMISDIIMLSYPSSRGELVLNALLTELVLVEGAPEYEHWLKYAYQQKSPEYHQAMKRKSTRYRKFFGDELYEELLWGTREGQLTGNTIAVQ